MADLNRQNIYGDSRNNMTRERYRLDNDTTISERNVFLIRSHIDNLRINSAGPQRCNKVSCILRTICRKGQFNLDTITKEDLIKILIDIKEIPKLSEATKTDYIIVLKQFYKWFEDEDDRLYAQDESVRRKIHSFYKYLKNTRLKEYKKKINPSDILMDEDIKEVLSVCATYREKAFIRTLHELGARAGEILNMKIKHVLFENDGSAKVLLDGKTGQRRVPIAYSVSYLRDYISVHPYKDNTDSFLWWTEKKSNISAPLKHNGAQNMIDRIWGRIPETKPVFKKKHNLHFFRHSRASLLAPFLTEAMLCKYMGWTLGSKQVKTYVHLSPDDLDKRYYENIGFVKEKDSKDNLKPKICQVCGNVNDVIADYCKCCARPLTSEMVVISEKVKEEQLKVTFDKMMEMMKNPEFAAFFESFKAKAKMG